MNKIAMLVAAAVLAGLFVTPISASAEPDDVTTAMAHLDQLNNQVDQANATLDAANRQLTADQQSEVKINGQINALARLQYKRPNFLIQFLDANSLGQVLADISSDRLLATKESVLLEQARTLRKKDQVARDQAAQSLTTLKTSREQAQKTADAAVAARDAAVRARAAAVASAAAAQPASWSGVGPWPNHFTYGYCTWYVANKRYIPWFGNAIDWWPNARPYGRPEGQTPQVGAVMVTRESGYGHVAYVESVHPDGSWTVSEMNFSGWNQVDTRTIHPGQVPLVGFIY